MTDTHVVPRSGLPALRISGTLIKKIDGKAPANKARARYHTLALYRLGDGRYAATISYITTWPGEQGHDLAEVLGSNPASATQFFRSYNPTSRVQGYPPGEQFAEKQRRLLVDIAASYASQVSELLASDLFTEDASDLRHAPIFSVSNHHVPDCGTPPLINGDDTGRYHGYYENEFGEQFLFVYDRVTREAWLYGGDISWETPRKVDRGRVLSLVLSTKENTWLHLCWETATGTKPMPIEEAAARVHRAAETGGAS